ncbi:MAG: Mur ligase domain-containing protein [Gammaproteobacteria bacterium]|nr:Mur ligase domain-containing protein [Gammaproteobacteria bacterium]
MSRYVSFVYPALMLSAGLFFFAYPGQNVDGRHFIPEAIKKGARAIISECPDSFHDGAIQPANANSPIIVYFKEVQKKNWRYCTEIF